MIITYVRSSSLNSYDWCEHKYYMEYVLGLYNDANISAYRGNIVHKIMEILGHQQLCVQNGIDYYSDDLIGVITPATSIEEIFNSVYTKYTEQSPQFDWTTAEEKTCRKVLKKGLSYQNGLFNPKNRHIISPEQYFDLIIPDDWAKYEFDYNGKKISGQLAIKGTLDMVTSIPGSDIYEVLDWKTGKPKDWNTGKDKDLNSLYDDLQLNLYYYAASTIYPQKTLALTIFYIDYGVSYTPAFGSQSLVKTKQRIRRYFERIKDNQFPKQTKTWKCSKMCYFGKNNYVTPEGVATGKTICEEIFDNNKRFGIKNTSAKYANPDFNLGSYNTGGGRSGVE